MPVTQPLTCVSFLWYTHWSVIFYNSYSNEHRVFRYATLDFQLLFTEILFDYFNMIKIKVKNKNHLFPKENYKHHSHKCSFFPKTNIL